MLCHKEPLLFYSLPLFDWWKKTAQKTTCSSRVSIFVSIVIQTHTKTTKTHSFSHNIHLHSQVATFVQPSHTGLCTHSRLTHFHNTISFIFKYTTSFIFNPLKCFIYWLLNFLCPRLFCLITWHAYNVIQYFLWNGLKMPHVTVRIMHNVAGI